MHKLLSVGRTMLICFSLSLGLLSSVMAQGLRRDIYYSFTKNSAVICGSETGVRTYYRNLANDVFTNLDAINPIGNTDHCAPNLMKLIVDYMIIRGQHGAFCKIQMHLPKETKQNEGFLPLTHWIICSDIISFQ